MQIKEMGERKLIKDYFAHLEAEVTAQAASILSKDLEKVSPEKYKRICSDQQLIRERISLAESECIENHQIELQKNKLLDSDLHEDNILKAAFANKQLLFASIKFKNDNNGSFGSLVKINQYISKSGLVLLKNELKKFSLSKSLDDNVGDILRPNENNNSAFQSLTNEVLKIWFVLKKIYETALHPEFSQKLYYEIDLSEFYTLKNVDFYGKDFSRIPSRALNETLVRRAEFQMISFLGNGIKSISYDAFSTLHRLEVLNLEHNHLETISAKLFDSLFSLKKLYLSHNRLKEIDSQAFEKLTQLEVLGLDGCENKFKYKSNMFKSLRCLKELKLAGIIGAEFNILDEMTDLKTLYLDNVFGKDALNETIYKNLVNLEEFSLQASNGVIEIKSNFMEKQSKLKYITIQDCKISKIHRNAFHHLAQLDSIWLLQCGLSYIDKGCFRGLKNLKKIDLSYNQFSEAHVFGFEDVDESKVFNM